MELKNKHNRPYWEADRESDRHGEEETKGKFEGEMGRCLTGD
jgi:hypothetical protein